MPKITDNQRQDRRQVFIAAALKCLRTASYEAVSVDEICSQAGSSKGAFYLYFASKRELLLALLDEQAAGFEHLVEDLAHETLDAATTLEQFITAQLREARDPAQLQLRADLWGAAANDIEVRKRLRAVTARRRAVLRRWVEDSIDAGTLSLDRTLANALASSLLALTDGLTLHRGIDPRGFRWSNIRTLLATVSANSGMYEAAGR